MVALEMKLQGWKSPGDQSRWRIGSKDSRPVVMPKDARIKALFSELVAPGSDIEVVWRNCRYIIVLIPKGTNKAKRELFLYALSQKTTYRRAEGK
jgi:hypothetical protein